ncbi:MAG: ABC transporter permease [Planctomycetes bacterium]|nr:ABC transporter permease [Planctomycetota bacterium]
MKLLPLILKHLRHNPVRTASTALAVAASIFLFCALETIIAAIDWGLKSASANRLVMRHSVSLQFPLPLAYKARIAGVPGVRRVATSNWFFGVYQDIKNFFPNFAVDAEDYLAIYPEYELPEAQRSELLRTLKGCAVGRDTAERFGWKAGDVFSMESRIPTYRKAEPFEFVICGIYEVDLEKNPSTTGSLMLFHHKYLYEGTGQRVQAGTYIIEIADPEKAPAIAQALDAMFENSDAPTKTETEAAFRAGFVSMGGNLALLLHTIGLAVTFTILLVTANTMSMAVRERRTEIGILKTLGFSDRRVLLLVLGEALLIGLAGGAIGIALGWVGIPLLPRVPFLGDALRGFPRLYPTPQLAAYGFGTALLVALAAGFAPAFLSYRARITQLLRSL